jgi:hypothetical protein
VLVAGHEAASDAVLTGAGEVRTADGATIPLAEQRPGRLADFAELVRASI